MLRKSVQRRVCRANCRCIVKANGDIRINPPTAYHWKVFWGGKLFFVLYRFVLPVR